MRYSNYGNAGSGSVDIVYLIIILVLFFVSMAVQSAVASRYKKYSKVQPLSGLTGAQAAQKILMANGVNTRITTNNGADLSDYYNPKTDTICLSASAYNNSSIAAIGVACHEAGHAIQYAKGYFPIKVRNAAIPISKYTSRLAFPLILIGFILSIFASQLKVIALVGIILFAVAVFIQLVTLPVEFDASRRALKNIRSCNLLTDEEYPGAASVLKMAALTYVVAMLTSLVQLLRFISMYRRR